MPSILASLPPAPKIAVLKPGGLGDFLATTPALRSLKAARPDARITLIARHDLVAFCRRYAYLERVVACPPFPGVADGPAESPAARAALAAIGMNTAAILGLAWLSAEGLLAAPPETIGVVLAVSAGANFVFLNLVAAISVAVLVNGLQSLNRKALAVTQALRDERADLLRTREKLREEIAVRRASEQALRQSLIMAQGNAAIFFTRPIALTFMLASMALFLLPVFRFVWGRFRGGASKPVEAT